MTFQRVGCILLLLSLTLGNVARAHELRPAIISLVYGDAGTAELTIDLNLEAALAGIGSEHDDTTQAPEAALYDMLRREMADDLVARLGPDGFDASALVSLPGSRVVAIDANIPPVGDTALPRHSQLLLAVEGLSDSETALTWNGAGSAAILRVDGADGEQIHSEFLQSGATSAPFPVPPSETGLFASIRAFFEGLF